MEVSETEKPSQQDLVKNHVHN